MPRFETNKGLPVGRAKSMERGVNLSVGIWGPPLWAFLHGMACTAKPEDAPYVEAVFQSLLTQLPCTLCANDYPSALATVRAQRNETATEACRAGHLVAFVFDLHAQVNLKLAKQRYAKLRALVPTLGDEPHAGVLALLEPDISLRTVERRCTVFGTCPWNVEALWILMQLLGARAHSAEMQRDFMQLLRSAAHFSSLLEDEDAQSAGERLMTAHSVLEIFLNKSSCADPAAVISAVLHTAHARRSLESSELSMLRCKLEVAQSR